MEETGKRGLLRKLAQATSPTELGLTTRDNIGFYLYYYFGPSTMIAAEFVTTDTFPLGSLLSHLAFTVFGQREEGQTNYFM